MFDFSVVELVLLTGILAVVLYLVYRLVRVATRHGVEDAETRRVKGSRGEGERPTPPPSA